VVSRLAAIPTLGSTPMMWNESVEGDAQWQWVKTCEQCKLHIWSGKCGCMEGYSAPQRVKCRPKLVQGSIGWGGAIEVTFEPVEDV